MSFSFALPAAAGAANAAIQTTTAGQAGAASGDPLGLFGQLLAMLGIDPKAAGELDATSLAQTLGKASARTGAKDKTGQDEDGKPDGGAPVDLSALIATLLAAAQQTLPPVAPTTASGPDQAGDGVLGAAKPPAPSQAQLESLLAALTGPAVQAEPVVAPVSTVAPGLDAASAQPATGAQPEVAPPPVADLPPDPVMAAIAPINPSEVAPLTPKAAASVRPGSTAKSAVSVTGVRAQSRSVAGQELAASAPQAQPATDASSQPSSGKKGADLALASADLMAEPADKPAKDEISSGPLTSPGSQPGANDAAAPLAAQAAVRGSPETVAKLAAQIVKKLDARTTRFDVALDPIGLGRVDVKVEIGANGRLHAQMSFDNAAAASDLRGRADQLRDALEQAGFDLKGGSLSFDVAGQGGQGRGQQQNQQDGQPRFAGAAGVFEAALNLGDTPISAPVWAKSDAASGVDIRI